MPLYENHIGEPDKHTLDCERRAGFEAGMAMRGECTLMKEPEGNVYTCLSCKFTILLENYDLEEQEEIGGYRFCGGCGRKITGVVK